MNATSVLTHVTCAVLLGGCAATVRPPADLTDARQVYARASVSFAATMVPADMSKARNALSQAEISFRVDPASPRTRRLAGIAYREAVRAEALTISAYDSAVAAKLEKEFPPPGAELVQRR